MKQDFKKLYNSKARGEKEKFETHDGTNTLYSHEFEEYYHSIDEGALNESLIKHIIPASNLIENRESLTVLDICYGLGFNALATIFYYSKYYRDTKLHIVSLELDEDLVKSLKEFDYPKEFDGFKDIINSLSDNFYYEDSNIKIEILIGDARDIIKSVTTKFDIIYQDAFSPQKNPALWSVEWFRALKTLSKKSVILTTYSIATTIRLSLHEAGFRVYECRPQDSKKITIASSNKLNLNEIDMKLKKSRSPRKAIWDSDIFSK